jgi:hypothetical protein
MRQINNIFDVQQVVKDLQDQTKKQLDFLQAQVNSINPDAFFISNETGANNAIQGGIPSTLKPGVVVNVLLKHTLAAGVCTFNGSPLKSHRNPANNIATGYAVGGIIELIWDGTNWQDLSQ